MACHLSSHIQDGKTSLLEANDFFKRFYIFRQRYTSSLPEAADGRPFVSTFNEVSCKNLENWTSFWDRKFKRKYKRFIFSDSVILRRYPRQPTDALLCQRSTR